MAKTEYVEVFIAMNGDGDSYIATDEQDAVDGLNSDYGNGLCRVVKIKVRMSAPVVAEANVLVPDEAGEVVAEAAE